MSDQNNSQSNHAKNQHANQHPHQQNRDEVYQLDTPQQHQDYYDRWAKTYDQDFVDQHGYAYPERVAKLFANIADDDDHPIADIGCGTGLVGLYLRQHPHWHPRQNQHHQINNQKKRIIHGFDISQGMLDVAAEKTHDGQSLYDGLFLADITRPLPPAYQGQYHGLISTGTFTLGHLGPDALQKALMMGAKGALALIGINAQHFYEKSFDQAFNNWQARGMIKTVKWHQVDIYHDPNAAETDSLTAWVAEFRIDHMQ